MRSLAPNDLSVLVSHFSFHPTTLGHVKLPLYRSSYHTSTELQSVILPALLVA